MDLMRAAGLEPRIDAAGNIFGRRAGQRRALKPILFGSHIDSVPSGGNFDGDLGSLSAIEVVRTLKDRGVTTRHPLEIVVWSNEEGALRSAAAPQPATSSRRTSSRSYNGVTQGRCVCARSAAIRRGWPTAESRRARSTATWSCTSSRAAISTKAGIPIGVVEGIVSIDEYEVEIRGFANHAGTTPMPERHDALLAAARLIDAVQEIVTREPGRQVGTVGRLEVSPNAPQRRARAGASTRSSCAISSPEKIARLGEADSGTRPGRSRARPGPRSR